MTSLGLTKRHIISNKTSVTSTYYINDILEKELKPAIQRTAICAQLTATKMFHNNGEGIFQQDDAHTSRASVEWLNKNINGYISPGDWSPNSPDLSPIENVWSIMAATVYAYPEPQTLNALKRRLRKAWTSNTSGNS